MHPPDNLSPVSTESLCVPVKPLVVKRNISHGGELPQRRSLRSSARTALSTLNRNHGTTKGSETHTFRTSLAMLLAPLSKGSRVSYTPAQSCQGSGSVTNTYTSRQRHTVEYTNHTRQHQPTARTCVLRHSERSRPREPATRTPIKMSLRTQLLLRYARQVIESSTGASKPRPRRPRFVMDVLLDLQALKNNEDVTAELLRSHHESIACLSRYAPAAEYAGGLMSLDGYWIEQPAHWANGTRAIEDGISTRFPESFERSTAAEERLDLIAQ